MGMPSAAGSRGKITAADPLGLKLKKSIWSQDNLAVS
jgi:hypothetical protein